MQDVNDLTNDLLDVYTKTKSKEIELAISIQLANLAGKIIKLKLGELAYNNFTRQDRKIDFFQGETKWKSLKPDSINKRKQIPKDNHNPYSLIKEINREE